MTEQSIRKTDDDTFVVNMTCPVRNVPLEVELEPQILVTVEGERTFTNVVLQGQIVDPPYEEAFVGDATISDDNN